MLHANSGQKVDQSSGAIGSHLKALGAVRFSLSFFLGTRSVPALIQTLAPSPPEQWYPRPPGAATDQQQHRSSRSPDQQLGTTVGSLRAFESTSYLEGDVKKLRFRSHIRGANAIRRFSSSFSSDAAKDE